ncbi:MAG: FliI/YscN family ATPase [Pseudomonadota bacterium]
MIAAQTRAAEKFVDSLTHLKSEARQIGKVVAHDAGLLEVTGFDYPTGYGGRLTTADGKTVMAEVAGFRGSKTMMVPLSEDVALRNGTRVIPSTISTQALVGDALLGRIIGPMGEALDGKGPILTSDHWPLAGRQNNVLRRGRVKQKIDLGVRAINSLLTAGYGQRIAVVAGSGVGKSVLMGQIIAGVDADIVVVGLIGERGREVSDFVETKLNGVMADKTVTVAVPADHSPILRLRAAYRATAIAEYYRDRGKKVLLLIDSLTRIAHAQREIGLALGEPPTMKGYPPSSLSIIPKLVERAGNDSQSGGSITAIYTVLADGDDLDDPVVDTARSIVDGHIILSRTMAEQGIFPAVDVARSLSRVAADIVDDDHHAAMINFRRHWSTYEENRDLILMGAYRAGNDEAIDEAIARRPDMLEFIRQPSQAYVSMPESIADLIAGFGL